MLDMAALDLPGWVYLVALWPLGFYAIWAFWNALRDSGDEKLIERSLGWPEKQGRVVSSKIVWGHVEVVYEYWVSGESYEGRHKINLPPQVVGGKALESMRAAQKLMTAANEDIAEYPVGEKIVVRYNPVSPAESVLYRKGEVSPHTTDEVESEPPHFVTLE